MPVRASRHHAHRTQGNQPPEEGSRRRIWRRASLGLCSGYGNTVSEMRPWKGLLLRNADEICRRTGNPVFQMCRVCASMEGELTGAVFFRMLSFLVIFVSLVARGTATRAEEASPFVVVLYMCVWKRPLLTDFVLAHYDGLREPLAKEGIQLDLFITGSDSESTASQAQKFNARFALHPNSPLGAKHDKGIQSLKKFYTGRKAGGNSLHLPHAVAIVGSDDVISSAFFLKIRDLMNGPSPRHHVVGLKDIYFYDLKSRRLVYTRGYRSYITPISGTLGCGRVFSWAILDVLDWHLWDVERERGLDQSAIRNVMTRVPLVGEVSVAIDGRKMGIMAVDIKSDGFAAGANIWKFEQVVEAVGKNGKLHDFADHNANETLGAAFGRQFLGKLEALRMKMVHLESE